MPAPGIRRARNRLPVVLTCAVILTLLVCPLRDLDRLSTFVCSALASTTLPAAPAEDEDSDEKEKEKESNSGSSLKWTARRPPRPQQTCPGTLAPWERHLHAAVPLRNQPHLTPWPPLSSGLCAGVTSPLRC